MTFAEQCTRIYTPRGKVAHLMLPFSLRGAICAVMPDWPGRWLGTGSQDEYEKAASLPLCTRCVAELKKQEETGS